MMNRNLLGVYSLIALLLLGVGLYRSYIGPDQGPPPKVETELPRKGADPGVLNDPKGNQKEDDDLDGEDPKDTNYSFSIDIEPTLTAITKDG